LATGLKWGCAGHSEIEHFIVYWFGACTGAILSIPVYKSPLFRQLFHGDEKIKDE
jgi:aquaporin rerated protein, invertebrate